MERVRGHCLPDAAAAPAGVRVHEDDGRVLTKNTEARGGSHGTTVINSSEQAKRGRQRAQEVSQHRGRLLDRACSEGRSSDCVVQCDAAWLVVGPLYRAKGELAG